MKVVVTVAFDDFERNKETGKLEFFPAVHYNTFQAEEPIQNILTWVNNIGPRWYEMKVSIAPEDIERNIVGDVEGLDQWLQHVEELLE